MLWIGEKQKGIVLVVELSKVLELFLWTNIIFEIQNLKQNSHN